jgi:hypothetical protein
VQALVGTPTEEGAQRRLDDFLASSGEFSLKAAIERIAPGIRRSRSAAWSRTSRS